VDKLCGDLSGLVTGMVKPLVDILWWVRAPKLPASFLQEASAICKLTKWVGGGRRLF
jgi:hypothetical protein